MQVLLDRCVWAGAGDVLRVGGHNVEPRPKFLNTRIRERILREAAPLYVAA